MHSVKDPRERLKLVLPVRDRLQRCEALLRSVRDTVRSPRSTDADRKAREAMLEAEAARIDVELGR